MADILKALRAQPDLYTLKGATEEEIKRAELELGLKFSPDYRKYVAEYGAASFACHELTGVCESQRLNVTTTTQEERRRNDVPLNWYVVEQVNVDGVVLWQDANGVVYQTMPQGDAKRLCGSLAEYVEM